MIDDTKEVLEDYDISDKCAGVAGDTTISMLNGLQGLAEESDGYSQPCFNHVLKLVVNEGLSGYQTRTTLLVTC